MIIAAALALFAAAGVVTARAISASPEFRARPDAPHGT